MHLNRLKKNLSNHLVVSLGRVLHGNQIGAAVGNKASCYLLSTQVNFWFKPLCVCVCVCVCVCARPVSPVWLFATPWNCSQQAPLSLEFPGKNTGVSCHFLPQALPNPGTELVSLVSVGLAGRLLTTRAIWEATMSFVNPGVLFLPPLWWREGLSSANAWVWGGDTWSRSPFHRGTWPTWMTT